MRNILVLLCLCSCASLPEQIAQRCAETSSSCGPAAQKCAEALRILGYENVWETAGEAEEGDTIWHAWVEFSEDGEEYVLDPYTVVEWGRYLYSRDEVWGCTYIARQQIQKIGDPVTISPSLPLPPGKIRERWAYPRAGDPWR